MQYPLSLTFRLLSLTSEIQLSDAQGTSIFYIRQKMFRLKEKVEVFADKSQKTKLFEINADRVIDWSASYHFTQADGTPWGNVRRRGAKSFWAATYEVFGEDGLEASIREESPMKKVVESLLGEIPLVGMFAVMVLNPSYKVTLPTGQDIFRLVKKPAVFEGKFQVLKLSELDEDFELRCLLSMIMLALLERRRG